MHLSLEIEAGIRGEWPICAHEYWPENAGRGVLGPFGPFEGPLSPTDGGVRGELGRLEAEEVVLPYSAEGLSESPVSADRQMGVDQERGSVRRFPALQVVRR